jgi:hypothetical protein
LQSAENVIKRRVSQRFLSTVFQKLTFSNLEIGSREITGSPDHFKTVRLRKKLAAKQTDIAIPNRIIESGTKSVL